MTAWTKGLDNAPKDRPILVRCPGFWHVPEVALWHFVWWETRSKFRSDSDICVLTQHELSLAEWAEIPQ